MSRMQFLFSLLCFTAFSFLPSAQLPADPLRAPNPSPGAAAAAAPVPATPGAVDIRDIRGVVELEEAPPYALYGAGALLALAAVAGGFLLWRRRSRRPAPATDPATLSLISLRQAAYLYSQSDPVRFAAAVSEIIRGYLEQRFELPVTTRTTAEFFDHLERTGEACPEPLLPHRQQLRHWLSLCDLVKYAGHRPDQPAISSLTEQAGAFIETTRPKPE